MQTPALQPPRRIQQRATLLEGILNDWAVFDEWVVRHPRRFATVMGWCEDGAQLTEKVSSVLALRLARRDEAMATKKRTTNRKTSRKKTPTKKGPSGGAPKKGGAADDEGLDEDDVINILEAAAGGAATAAGGPLAGLGVAAGAEVARRIPWEELLAAIESAVTAKKERELWQALVKVWEEIGGKKDAMIAILIGPQFTPAQRARAEAELLPKLKQIQEVARMARLKIEEGDKEEARKRLKQLAALLRQLRDWLRQFP